MRVDSLQIDGKVVNESGVVTNVPHGFLDYYRQRSEVVHNPEHAARLHDPNAWVPPSGYFASGYKRSYNRGHEILTLTGQEWVGEIDFTGFPQDSEFWGAPDTSNLYTDTVFKFRDKIKDQDVQFGAAFAEAGQTIRLIGDTCSALGKAYTAVKHGSWRQAADELRITYSKEMRRRMEHPRGIYRGPGDPASKRLANRWLELQYGWKPLLSDADGAIRKLANDATAVPTRMRFKSQATVRIPYRLSVCHDEDPGGDSYVKTVQFNNGYRGLKLVGYWAVINAQAVEAARNGLLDIADTAWEVTPWSFVVDWAFPVGKVLNSLTATAGKEFLSGTMTSFSKLDAKRVKDVVRSPASAGFSSSGVGSKGRFFTMDRQVLTDFPPVPLPHVKNPLSVTHALNGLALLVGSARVSH